MHGTLSKKLGKMFYYFHLVFDILIIAFVFFAFDSQINFNNISNIQSLEIIIFLVGIIYLTFKILEIQRCGRKTYNKLILNLFIAISIVNLIAYTLLGSVFNQKFNLIEICTIIMIDLIVMSIWKALIYKIYPSIYRPKRVFFAGNDENVFKLARTVVENSLGMFEARYVFNNITTQALDLVSEVDFIFLDSNIQVEDKEKLLNFSGFPRKKIFIVNNKCEKGMLNFNVEDFGDIRVKRIV